MDEEKSVKSYSLDSRKHEIEKEFLNVYPRKEPAVVMREAVEYEPSPWILDYFDDYVIIADKDKYFKVNYSLNGEKVEFAPRSEWKEAVAKSEWVAIKAGARNSKRDQARLQTMHDYAVENGAQCGPKEEAPAAKATGLDMGATTYNTPPLAIKIAGEMELDVCYMPYSGQRGGKDADGQYFSPRTNEHAAKFPTPLVLYYHGYKAQGQPSPMPIEIGASTNNRWQDKAGRWLRVKLDAAIEEANQVWQSAQKGNARASSDSVAHLVRIADDGEIINWPFVGISLFETETGKKPANSYAFALPAAKALGIDVTDPEDHSDEIKQIAAAVASIALQIMK